MQFPTPHCCPSDTLDASDGYYDKYDTPRCKCEHDYLGFSNPQPCCSLAAPPTSPRLFFMSNYKGSFTIHKCNGTCSALSCYNHPDGCIAFNKSHLARNKYHTQHENSLVQAFMIILMIVLFNFIKYTSRKLVYSIRNGGSNKRMLLWSLFRDSWLRHQTWDPIGDPMFCASPNLTLIKL